MKKQYIFILLAAMAVASCNVLDQVSPTQVSATKVFTNQRGAESALVGLYSTLQNNYYYGGYYPLLSDLYTDVSKAGGFNVTSLDEFSNQSLTSSNQLTQNMYVQMYYTIAAANGIINNLGTVTDPNFTQAARDSIMAHALTIRALAHFDLLRVFGQHWDVGSVFGIPVVKTVQKAGDVVARNTVAETYQAILDDLNAAYTKIPKTTYNNAYINPAAIQGLLARVYLYMKDMPSAISAADQVIGGGAFSLLNPSNFTSIYTSRQTSESLFELVFNVQNRSAYNIFTYSRTGALITEVLFVADSTLNNLFLSRPGDLRAQLVDFDPATESNFLPFGRTQKYRGEVNLDNSAFILRLAEVYLIRAEAKGWAGGGLTDVNTLRESRGLSDLTDTDVGNIYNGDFPGLVLEERLAELNFEGHRMFDMARLQRRGLILQGGAEDDYRDIWPIPNREIIATNGVMVQNPGY